MEIAGLVAGVRGEAVGSQLCLDGLDHLRIATEKNVAGVGVEGESGEGGKSVGFEE